jgi:hypothetical protein
VGAVPLHAATFQVTSSPLAGLALAPLGFVWLALVLFVWWRGAQAPGWLVRRGDGMVWIGFVGLYPDASRPQGAS